MLDLALFDGGVKKLEYSAQKVGPNVADSKKATIEMPVFPPFSHFVSLPMCSGCRIQAKFCYTVISDMPRGVIGMAIWE